MYVVFRDTSFNYHRVSKNALDYPDHLSLLEAGHLVKVMEGSRKECDEFIEQTVPDYV